MVEYLLVFNILKGEIKKLKDNINTKSESAKWLIADLEKSSLVVSWSEESPN